MMASGVFVPPKPAASDGSASQRMALANTRSQSLGLPAAPAVSMASAVGQFVGGVNSQWQRMPTTARRPRPTSRRPIMAGEPLMGCLGIHGWSCSSLRTSATPLQVAAPRTTTFHAGPKSSDIGGSQPVVLAAVTVNSPRTP